MSTNKIRMKVTSVPVTIDDKSLIDYKFEIPLYQREYAWELEQVSDLFYDIEKSEDSSPHYLGSILLFEKDSSTREIIDGQQRLTTIFLILYSIRTALLKLDSTIDKKRIDNGIKIIDNIIYKRSKKASIIDEGTEPRLTTGKRDKRLFRAILKGEELNNLADGRRKSHKLLLNALHNFLDLKIQQLITSEGISGVLNFLDKVTSCEYIVMSAENKEDQFLLFKTLNSRGIELSEADLIKNEICSKPKGGTTDQEAVDLWDEMREILEKDKANVDTFLFHFINHLTDSQTIRKEIEAKGNLKNIEDIKDSYPPVSEKLLFSVYDRKLKSINNTETFLETLKEAALKYVEIYNPPTDKIYLTSLRAMNITKCYPLLLKGKKVLSDENFDLLCKAIECISFRHSILKKDPKELEKFYYQLLDKLNSDLDIDKVIEEIKSHQSVASKYEDKFKKEFIIASPKSNVSKMILDRIVRTSEHETLNWLSKDIQLEHIMPQRPKDKWLELKNSDSDLYEMSVNRLGNLTLIKGKLNLEMSNYEFKVKKEGYIKSRLNINHDLLESKKWDFDTIDVRQEKLYELAKNIWVI